MTVPAQTLHPVELLHPADVGQDLSKLKANFAALPPRERCIQGPKLLTWAIECDQCNHFQWLLTQGVSPNGIADFGQSALSNAFKKMDTYWSAALLDAGADPYAIEAQGFAAYYWSFHRGNVGQVHMLLGRGVSTESRFHFKLTPLHVAVEQGHYELTAFLLGRDASFEAVDDRGRTPMAIAMKERSLGLMELLLDAGENPQVWLSHSVRMGDLDVVKLLCEAGARPQDRDLVAAVESGHQVMLDRLLQEEGVNPNAREADGDKSILHLAAQKGHSAMVASLLDAGADANIRRGDPEHNTTPLMEAACHGHPMVVDALLARGARVNATFRNRSAFIFASVGKAIFAGGDQKSAAKCLVEHGADVHQNVYQDSWRAETALSRAEGKHGDADMAQYCRRVMDAEKRVRLTMWGTSVFQYQGAPFQSSPAWGLMLGILCFTNRNMRGKTTLPVLPPELWSEILALFVSAHEETRNPRLSSWRVGVEQKAIAWFKTDNRDVRRLQIA